MLTQMNYDLIFDRKIDKNVHYISPGGFSIVTKGKMLDIMYDFDFLEYFGSVDDGDPTILHVSHLGLDLASFQGAENITSEDIQKAEFSEFYVYTGEKDEEEIHPKTVRNLSFIIDGDCVVASHKLTKSANKVLTD